MNKVININFQGSIIPIEESASELLRNYINSLREYFASEEGRDEIISDIESRIAELFLQRLKMGKSCITDNDMQEIMKSIGYPEDLKAAEDERNNIDTSHLKQDEKEQNKNRDQKRLFRAANQQVIGGVAAGVAEYLGIDVSIMRVLFVFCVFAGFGFIVYLVLWAVLPAKEINVYDVRMRKLFRDSEHKKIAGVASGIAAYFEIDVWVPRIVFLSPIVLLAIGEYTNSRFDTDITDFIFTGFGGSLFAVYFVLWAVLPEANTAAEKLQMRGEKIDLESIKKTVNDELNSLKGRAEQWGKETEIRAKEKVKMMQGDFIHSAQNFTKETNSAARRTSSRVGYGLGVLAKVFVLGILGIIIFSLVISFAGISTWLLSGHQIIDFILIDETEKTLLWATLILFIGVPIIGLLMWLVRAIRGDHSRNKYVGYMFSFFHVLGWISLISLIIHVSAHFKSKARESATIEMIKPSTNNLVLKVDPFEDEDLIEDWRSGNPWPKTNRTEDSIYSDNIKVKVVQSKDSLYHLQVLKMANGKQIIEATEKADAIQYRIVQQDSIMHLSKYFVHHKKDKFYLQRLIVLLEIPIGSTIKFDKSLDEFDWNDIRINTGNGFTIEHYDNDDEIGWNYNRAYQMGVDGLEKLGEHDDTEE